MNKLELIDQLKSDITYELAFDHPIKEKSWSNQYGILITVEQAELFIQLLEEKI